MPTSNAINANSSGLVRYNGTGTFDAVTTTDHSVLIGSPSNGITNVGPISATGAVLQSNGLGSDPGFSSATYPSIATSTGTILRADGSNWVPSTSTYPNTNAINTLLYASSANVMSSLATANNGVLTTSSTGVPSIDTTNFQVLTTGVQMKGNNTNTNPPSGFIGEQIRSFVGAGSAVSLTTATAANITSISLTAGIWDITGLININFSTTGTLISGSVNSTSATNGTNGDNRANLSTAFTSTDSNTIIVPNYRVLLSGTTTYFLIATAVFATGTSSAYGRITAVRVG